MISHHFSGAGKPLRFLSTHHPLLRLSSTAAAADSPTTPTPHFIIDYLVSHCGFSPDKAASASNLLRPLKSPHQPDSVLAFFRSHGFTAPQINKLISWNPRWLALDVGKTLAPKFRSLSDLGFTGPDLTYLILSNPTLLHLSLHRSILPKIAFWTGLLGSTALLMRALKRNHSVLSYSIDKKVLPNLALLREYGVPDARTAMIVLKHPRFVLQRLEALRTDAEWVESMGIPRSSGMFLWALWVHFLISPKNFQAKRHLMRSYGWSENDFVAAFRKAPSFVMVGEQMIRAKMDFLVKVAGCELSYVAFYPDLLMYSLEKRMIPRHQVMQLLKARALRGDYTVRSIMNLSEARFMKNFVLKHKEEVPELYDLYVGGCKKRVAR